MNFLSQSSTRYWRSAELDFFFEFLLAWRNLWTLPGRKRCTRSSSFPNTIPMPNFKPISLTVLEFWKRYHQNLHLKKSRQNWTSLSKIWPKKVKISHCDLVLNNQTWRKSKVQPDLPNNPRPNQTISKPPTKRPSFYYKKW
jgi:hypothetical protein